MLVVGLTGGVGSGKTTVARLFAALGAPVIDADEVAREVVEPGTPGLESVVEMFGTGILGPEGRLDRRALRERVFADPGERERLESVLHPLIRARILERLATLEAPYAVLVIPLLLEGGQAYPVDRVLVVDAPEEAQVRRVCARDGSAPDLVRGILAAQTTRAHRRARADDLLDNTGEPMDLQPQVTRLHRGYLALACDRTGEAG